MTSNFDTRQKLVDGGVGGQVFVILLINRSENTHNIRSSQSINRDETQALGDTERLQTSRLKRSWWTGSWWTALRYMLMNRSESTHNIGSPQSINQEGTQTTAETEQPQDSTPHGSCLGKCPHTTWSHQAVNREGTQASGETERPQDSTQAEVAWEVGGPFFINCAQNALIPPGLIKLSTGKGHRPQARQNDLKIRHQTEVAWEVGGPSIQ
ncbi:hypothetical protein B0H16DRAFT_1697483 [Mycena metata]|uniref:Uncharacterized protein n=1 Tax=Mycena metata TaxID=1033252 RepID=A0AAD7HUA0_9AGAR|nr:hypothetical protein B0H16DRAFT_1697483 [Mycena metata]